MIGHLLADIEAHFKKEYPREGCGILAVQKGKMLWFPSNNKATGDDDFVLDSTLYFKINRTADIVGIVHSHPDASSEPSDSDMQWCNTLGVPYYIFSYPEMNLTVVNPIDRDKSLMGREYKFGVNDCFEAIRDWYKSEMSITIPGREAYEDNWWMKGLDYFSEEYVTSRGFKVIDFKRAEKGDLLVFAVGSEINNHCGIYLGGNVFYHHAQSRLSCREALDTIWMRGLTGVYRYVA